MRLATTEQMREIEKTVEKEFDIGPEILMETAGSLSAREIQTSYLPELSRGRVAVVCGPGNNGGDGLVTARHLHSLGVIALKIYIWAPENARSPLFKRQLGRALKQGLVIIDLIKESAKISEIHENEIIVDSLFGVGLSRDLTDELAQIVDEINANSGVVISLDVPSGIESNTGKILNKAVHASLTLTYGLAKLGLYINEGPAHTGRLRVLQIGFPTRAYRDVATTYFAFNERLARRWLPKRETKSNKSTHGHVLIYAGSPGLWGAGELATQAAYRIGAGYVTLAVPDDVSKDNFVKDVGAEVLVKSRKDSSLLEKINAVVVGPGAGANSELKNFIIELKNKKFERVVLDADALTVLSKEEISQLPETWILTPHSQELARLLNTTSENIEENRLHAVTKASKKYGCFVLLKGFRTLIAGPDGRVLIITSGNSALAKAGTGDVLSGFIGGLLAQDVDPLQAVATAAYFHGRLADEWLRSNRDVKSFMPRDLLATTPQVLEQLSHE